MWAWVACFASCAQFGVKMRPGLGFGWVLTMVGWLLEEQTRPAFLDSCILGFPLFDWCISWMPCTGLSVQETHHASNTTAECQLSSPPRASP